MKMKEICLKTGLTERAVRFYVEKGLAAPQSDWKNGRTYFEFMDEDVLRLKQIAALRQYGFAVEDIRDMYYNGEKTGLLLRTRIQSLENESEQMARQAKLLQQLPETYSNGAALGNALLRLNVEDFGRVDAVPDFGKMDDLTKEEKKTLAERAKGRLQRQSKWKRLLTGAVAALLLITAGILGKLWQEAHQTFTILSGIAGDIVFTDLDYREAPDGRKVPSAYISTPQGDFLGVFEDSFVYDSLFSNTPYAMIQIEIHIPQKELKALGFDPGRAASQMEEIKGKVLSDDALSFQYLTIVRVQGRM